MPGKSRGASTLELPADPGGVPPLPRCVSRDAGAPSASMTCTLFYLHGFASSPGSYKAGWLARRLAPHGLPLRVPDLNGGDFGNLTLSRQAAVVREEIADTRGEVVLVGSSFGGYLAALVAECEPRVTRLVLLAPAFGAGALFARSLGSERLAAWRARGWLELPAEIDAARRRLHFAAVADALEHDARPLRRQLPALLCHGVHDATVPFAASVDYLRGNRAAQLLLLPDEHSLHASLEGVWGQLCLFLGLDPGVPESPVDAAPAASVRHPARSGGA
ncbi:MAG TPA: YqiA/YcfP family alpha/beta fold hydrolase [Gammaproteobacteria bacterium]